MKERESQPTPEEMLDRVCDKDSFIAFVQALAGEREDAEKIEKENQDIYFVDGAHNWKNADIASFLHAALGYFDERPFHKAEQEPSWKMFAEFLYVGKIYE
ncbi:MAG TPA: hypothetical protein PLD20_03395 [Blastocatellia bacterium]|nr:hypothetical protein [Blastocatellia bacterium]HMX29635.1 hypothetical protein [Blastocatellia bacterium]HMY75915.1 hypothetical protein [Blastocatellia bacterium]HMZ16947.1 hypothetical protein [Blastocatellia bacterium]HNG34443.1 hypothetical protein [Blastocatellia bacterium]